MYTSLWGSLFASSHIVQIIMQAVMLEKCLYKVPHEHGWFEAPNAVSEGSTVELPDEAGKDIFDSDQEKDDGFQKANSVN